MKTTNRTELDRIIYQADSFISYDNNPKDSSSPINWKEFDETFFQTQPSSRSTNMNSHEENSNTGSNMNTSQSFNLGWRSSTNSDQQPGIQTFPGNSNCFIQDGQAMFMTFGQQDTRFQGQESGTIRHESGAEQRMTQRIFGSLDNDHLSDSQILSNPNDEFDSLSDPIHPSALQESTQRVESAPLLGLHAPQQNSESIPETVPSERTEVERGSMSSTTRSQTTSPSSNDSMLIEGESMNEPSVNENLAVSVEKKKRKPRRANNGAPKAGGIRKKQPSQRKFDPRQSSINTVPNKAHLFLEHDQGFSVAVQNEVCREYGFALDEIKDYFKDNIKGRVRNYTDLAKVIGNTGLSKSDSQLPKPERLKRAAWMVFQIFLREEGGHFNRWVNGKEKYHYQPGGNKHSKDGKGFTNQEKRDGYIDYRKILKVKFSNPEKCQDLKKGMRKKSAS